MKLLLFLLLANLTINCSSKVKLSSSDDLVFSNGKEKIELKILTGENYLEDNKVNDIKVILKNINPKTMSFSGYGIKYSKDKTKYKNQVLLEIEPNKTVMKSDTLKIIVSYKKEQNITYHEFKIPVK